MYNPTLCQISRMTGLIRDIMNQGSDMMLTLPQISTNHICTAPTVALCNGGKS